jgi:hypothetical protein
MKQIEERTRQEAWSVSVANPVPREIAKNSTTRIFVTFIIAKKVTFGINRRIPIRKMRPAMTADIVSKYLLKDGHSTKHFARLLRITLTALEAGITERKTAKPQMWIRWMFTVGQRT